MSSFHLQIVTPDGLFYDGQAESLNLRAAFPPLFYQLLPALPQEGA